MSPGEGDSVRIITVWPVGVSNIWESKNFADLPWESGKGRMELFVRLLPSNIGVVIKRFVTIFHKSVVVSNFVGLCVIISLAVISAEREPFLIDR